jgi:hypothetical protein
VQVWLRSFALLLDDDTALLVARDEGYMITPPIKNVRGVRTAMGVKGVNWPVIVS